MKSTVNIKKLKELIVYICDKNDKNPRFGSTVLNKMLFFSDFYWYAITGKSITNDNYIRREWGPTPQHLVDARRELEEANIIRIEDRKFFGKTQKRPVVLGEYNIEELTNDEKLFVDFVIDRFEKFTGKEISDYSHNLPWKVSEDEDIIPYETVFASHKSPIPESTIQWAKKILAERKLRMQRKQEYETTITSFANAEV